MHIRLLLPLVSAGLLAAQRVDADGDDEFAAAAGGRATVTVHAWPVSAATSTPFAEAVYGGGGRDATWQLLGDNNEEEEEEEEQERDGGGDELVRVGLAESDGVPWRGTVTTRRLLRDGAVVLRLEPAGASVWFVVVRPRSAVGAPPPPGRLPWQCDGRCGGRRADGGIVGCAEDYRRQDGSRRHARAQQADRSDCRREDPGAGGGEDLAPKVIALPHVTAASDC